MGPRLWGSAGAGSRTTSLECVEEHLGGTTCRCFAPNRSVGCRCVVSARKTLFARTFSGGRARFPAHNPRVDFGTRCEVRRASVSERT